MIKELPNGFIGVEVPEIKPKDYWAVINDNMLVSWNNYIKLPPGSYTLIGRAGELTEEQIKEIVESKDLGKNNLWYKDYEATLMWFRYPARSFRSLLLSLGLNNETTIVLKKVK